MSSSTMIKNHTSFALINLLLVVFVGCVSLVHGDYATCYQKGPCFLKKVPCPAECPSLYPTNPNAKVCYINCKSPICQPVCRSKKPNCNSPGAACLDPRFIGGDGIVFYFHGKSNRHFALVSDTNLQINARFIGLRPAGRLRDFTWIQALGVLTGGHTFSVEATKAEKWDQQVEHLRFLYDGRELDIPEGYPSNWESSGIRIERTAAKNSALIQLAEIAEISVNVVPVTKEDDRIHSYRIPSDDCFAHLEVQFRFYGLSAKVEGVLGRTYRPDFVNPAKAGVAMAVVGGEDKYETTSLLGSDCSLCVYSENAGVDEEEEDNLVLQVDPTANTIDCSGGSTGENGIICRK